MMLEAFARITAGCVLARRKRDQKIALRDECSQIMLRDAFVSH